MAGAVSINENATDVTEGVTSMTSENQETIYRFSRVHGGPRGAGPRNVAEWRGFAEDEAMRILHITDAMLAKDQERNDKIAGTPGAEHVTTAYIPRLAHEWETLRANALQTIIGAWSAMGNTKLEEAITAALMAGFAAYQGQD